MASTSKNSRNGMAPQRPLTHPAKPQPTHMFMAGGAVLCALATVVLLLQPRAEQLAAHRQLAAGCALVALLFFGFSRPASPIGMPDSVLAAALAGIALAVVVVMVMAWPGRWRFAVQDSGPGIAAGHLPRLFLPFSQLDDSAQRLHGGSGLGLSICRQLALGADVGVSSEPGRGSRFWADLPLLPDTGAAPPQAVPVAAGPTLAGMRALVVEAGFVDVLSKPIEAPLLKALLARLRHEPRAA